MKLRLLTCMLLTSMAAPVFADETHQLPIDLYLLQEAYWPPPYLGAGQMTVTPTADGGGIIYINLEYYTTTDGSCGTLQTNPIVSIAQNFGGTTLLANHPYTTTGASNYFVFVTNSNPHTTDVKFYFSTNGTTALGNKSDCVPLSQMTCTGSTCDFGNPVVWSWTP